MKCKEKSCRYNVRLLRCGCGQFGKDQLENCVAIKNYDNLKQENEQLKNKIKELEEK